MATAIENSKRFLYKPQSIAPLVVFRVAFGFLMLASILRFISKGWVYSMYVAPKMHFPYYGFEWVKALPPSGMYLVFAFLILFCLGILLGAFYRLSTVGFFVLFTYIELIDKTNYLNHYYFISLVSFLLIFIPAGKAFSIDNIIFRRKETNEVPRAFLFMLQLQMFIVYFFAGVAKINSDWLLEAQPLKIWLPAFSHYPVIGQWMEEEWLAYAFSWFGCIYDLCIGFLLFNRRSVYFAYFLVVVFHSATALFFNIGMFPYIMMCITIVFFPEGFHEKVLLFFKKLSAYKNNFSSSLPVSYDKPILLFFTLYFVIQFALPFRYVFYPGNLFWTEQGYRFSWRVMLMEKAGTAFFTLYDKNSGKEIEINNDHHLTFLQEKMMATQPDMMVDYAKYLKNLYEQKGFRNFEIRAKSFVTLNGSGSRNFIDTAIDLSAQSNSFFTNKNWVKSY